MADFWGGYRIEFKIIELGKITERTLSPDQARREAAIVGPEQRRTFMIDISKFEYCKPKRQAEVDNYTIYGDCSNATDKKGDNIFCPMGYGNLGLPRAADSARSSPNPGHGTLRLCYSLACSGDWHQQFSVTVLQSPFTYTLGLSQVLARAPSMPAPAFRRFPGWRCPRSILT